MVTVSPFDLVTLLSALGCGLVGGIFYAFSSFVMKGLGNLPPGQGIAAMQSINVAVINPWFMTPFLGTAAFCVFVTIVSLPRWPAAAALFLLAGSLLYLVGTMLVTFLFNVPLNNALERLGSGSPEAGSVWVGYLSSWTAWNHVRTVAALAASASFIMAFRCRG